MDLDARLAPLFAAQHGVVARVQVLWCGGNDSAIRRRLRRGVWRVVHAGVYALSGAPATLRLRYFAACLASQPDGALSHRSAAAELGLVGFNVSFVEISTSTQFVASGVRVHRTQEMVRPWTIEQSGLRITSIPRTLVDLCAVTPFARVEQALDVASVRGEISVEYQWAQMNRMGTRGRCGTARLRDALAERMAIGSPQSVAETRFAGLIRELSLPGGLWQYVVSDDDFQARVDFAWPELKLAVEIDSWRWHTTRDNRRRDARRQNRLERMGWTVLRFYWEDVTSDPEYVKAEIRAAYLRLRG